MKGNQIDDLIRLQNEIQMDQQRNPAQNNEKPVINPMRAILMVLDMTKSIQIKDFKPSRLSIAVQMIKQFIKRAKDFTPVLKFSFAIVEAEMCKVKVSMTTDENLLLQTLDMLKVSPKSGFFSLENTLRVALDVFEDIPNEYNKQILIIQSSPMSKDYRDIYDTIQLFSTSHISVNIISMVGWTFVYQKLVQKAKGHYKTVRSNQQFKKCINIFSQPSPYQYQRVERSLIKMTLCRREFSQTAIECFCHFRNCCNYFVCGVCEAVICREPALECPICQAIVIMPTDLSRHRYV